jgi:hypothetical protein
MGSTSMLPAFTSPRCLPPEKSRTSTLAGTWLELCARWPTGAGAARVHRCSKTSTRPSPRRSRGRFMAACASHDFCRSMFQRARQWTARTSRTSGIRGRDGCRLDRSLPFDRGQTAEGTQGQGPRITEPRRSLPGLLPEETSPQPRSLQTPRVAGIARRPVRSRRGRRARPPALHTLARHGQREGRATPDLREEIGRSPTRGAFHRKAVRERGRLLGRREPIRSVAPAPFSLRGDRARDARAGPGSPVFR